jgi:hypothetical protein
MPLKAAPAGELRPSAVGVTLEMDIDWQALERLLVELSKADIQRFAAEHRDETFYGFAFDCESEYGQVLLCLNTPDDLHRVAVQYSKGDTPGKAAWAEIHRKLSEKLGRPPEEEPRKTPEEEAVSLRWSLGDWKYQGLNTVDFEKGWESFEEAVSEACSDEEQDEETFMTPTQDSFMRAACRAVIRLEMTGAFDALIRTADFKTYVADHDEWEKDSWSRLEAVRQELASG